MKWLPWLIIVILLFIIVYLVVKIYNGPEPIQGANRNTLDSPVVKKADTLENIKEDTNNHIITEEDTNNHIITENMVSENIQISRVNDNKNISMNNQTELVTKKPKVRIVERDAICEVVRGSKGEEIACKVMEEIYSVPFNSIRPDFLTNPETGRRLELDCYNEKIKIAIEYNGIQHYKWPNFTGQSKEQFIAQVRRDKLKVELCDKHGIYLITVPYHVKHADIPAYIKAALPKNN